MVGVRLNAFTGKILWYTLGFFHFSRQPQRGICRDEGRLIQCLTEAAPQHPLQPPHCSRIVRHLLRESLVDEGRQPQIFRRQPLQPETEPDASPRCRSASALIAAPPAARPSARLMPPPSRSGILPRPCRCVQARPARPNAPGSSLRARPRPGRGWSSSG